MLFFDQPQIYPDQSARVSPPRAVAIRRAGGVEPPHGPSRRDHDSRRAAFTLLELLVVIGLLAILTSFVVGLGRRAAASGQATRAKAELAALSAALDTYKLAYGDYPRTDQPARLLQSLIGKRGPAYQSVSGRALLETAKFRTAGALDPFTSESAELLDPWAQSYRYFYQSQNPWTNPSYVLYSVGPDGTDSTTLLSGGFPDDEAAGQADNLYANR